MTKPAIAPVCASSPEQWLAGRRHRRIGPRRQIQSPNDATRGPIAVTPATPGLNTDQDSDQLNLKPANPANAPKWHRSLRAGVYFMNEQHIAAAASVLAREALVTAFGHVSVRLSEHALAITPPAPLNTVTPDTTLIEVPLDSVVLPEGAPGETWIHLAIYNARADVHAIARAQPPSSHPAGAASESIAPVHGQGAWIGAKLPIHGDARLVRSHDAGKAVAKALGQARAVLLRGNGAVTVGTDPREAATMQWVVEQTCAHALRAVALTTRPLTDVELNAWYDTWDELWPRLWAYLSPAH